jgi:hypothetical protein
MNRGFGRCLSALTRPVWTPEADERRFLSDLAIVLFLVIPMWGKGWIPFLGANPVLIIAAGAWIVYLVIFWKRLRYRGELGRVLIVPAAYLALLLSVRWL